jgi:hypothetical protein
VWTAWAGASRIVPVNARGLLSTIAQPAPGHQARPRHEERSAGCRTRPIACQVGERRGRWCAGRLPCATDAPHRRADVLYWTDPRRRRIHSGDPDAT